MGCGPLGLGSGPCMSGSAVSVPAQAPRPRLVRDGGVSGGPERPKQGRAVLRPCPAIGNAVPANRVQGRGYRDGPCPAVGNATSKIPESQRGFPIPDVCRCRSRAPSWRSAPARRFLHLQGVQCFRGLPHERQNAAAPAADRRLCCRKPSQRRQIDICATAGCARNVAETSNRCPCGRRNVEVLQRCIESTSVLRPLAAETSNRRFCDMPGPRGTAAPCSMVQGDRSATG